MFSSTHSSAAAIISNSPWSAIMTDPLLTPSGQHATIIWKLWNTWWTLTTTTSWTTWNIINHHANTGKQSILIDGWRLDNSTRFPPLMFSVFLLSLSLSLSPRTVCFWQAFSPDKVSAVLPCTSSRLVACVREVGLRPKHWDRFWKLFFFLWRFQFFDRPPFDKFPGGQVLQSVISPSPTIHFRKLKRGCTSMWRPNFLALFSHPISSAIRCRRKEWLEMYGCTLQRWAR